MKNVMLIWAALAMALSLTGCPDDNKNGGGGGTVAASPNRDDCRYDVRTAQFRTSDGTFCDYEDYHDSDACYNYYYSQHTSYTRSHPRYKREPWSNYSGYFTDEYGNMRNCSLQYLDLHTYFPYRFFQPGYGFNEGCQFWGFGFIPVPMGPNAFVCVYYNQFQSHQQFQYVSPYYGYGGYYGGFGGGFQLGLEFLLHLN